MCRFEKMAAGMSTIEPTPLALVPFLRKAMRAHTIPAQAKEIDFTLDIAEADANIAANIDPIKMTVVFRNLYRCVVGPPGYAATPHIPGTPIRLAPLPPQQCHQVHREGRQGDVPCDAQG